MLLIIHKDAESGIDEVEPRDNHEMANLAVVFEAEMDANAIGSNAMAHEISENETAANGANQVTSNNQDAIMAALNNTKECIDKVETGSGRRCFRGRGRKGGIEGGDVQPSGEERKPCQHCGKRHKLLNDKCWTLDANKGNLPKNYIKSPPSFGGNGN